MSKDLWHKPQKASFTKGACPLGTLIGRDIAFFVNI